MKQSACTEPCTELPAGWPAIYEHRIIQGDVLDGLRKIPDGYVHCVVTSPPYLWLRNYGIDGQIGLEASVDEYIKKIVEVFREVRRVLRDDGVLFLNIGDSYAGSGRGPTGKNGIQQAEKRQGFTNNEDPRGKRRNHTDAPEGFKAKDMIGIPWAVAKALQAPYYSGRIKSERDRAWLAAMIDGEGSIGATHHIRNDDGRPRTFVNIHITNTSLKLLDEADRIWPANRHEHITNGEGHLGKRPCFRWIVNGVDNQIALLREVYPHLIVKKEQAKIAYNLLLKIKIAKHMGHTPQKDSARQEREKLARAIQSLNAGEEAEIPEECIEPETLFEPGWYLRSDIIWAKRNCMPESVTDRPTKSHEFIFLMTKKPRYYYDGDAIREPASESYTNDKRPQGVLRQCVNENSKYDRSRGQFKKQDLTGNPTYTGFNEGWKGKNLQYPGKPRGMHVDRANGAPDAGDGITRNARTVWTISTQARPEAHFATFPDELPRRCISAGTSEYGCCPKCGAPYQREVECTGGTIGKAWHPHENDGVTGQVGGFPTAGYTRTFKGWKPGCSCDAGDPVPCIVLDPFWGTGTVTKVARDLGRSSIGCELNPEYIKIGRSLLQVDSQLDTGCIRYLFETCTVPKRDHGMTKSKKKEAIKA